MSTADNTHPNLETIQGLREAADWLEQHPELPKAFYASVALRSPYQRENAREELTALAAALGDRAEETPALSAGEVCIKGRFGNVLVSANAKIQDLRDEAPIEPDYEPIIKHADSPMDVFS